MTMYYYANNGYGAYPDSHIRLNGGNADKYVYYKVPKRTFTPNAYDYYDAMHGRGPHGEKLPDPNSALHKEVAYLTAHNMPIPPALMRRLADPVSELVRSSPPAKCEQYARPPCEEVPGKIFCYKVYFGTTLSAIGKEFGLDWQMLCTLNKMKDCDCLFAEDTYLQIPISH